MRLPSEGGPATVAVHGSSYERKDDALHFIQILRERGYERRAVGEPLVALQQFRAYYFDGAYRIVFTEPAEASDSASFSERMRALREEQLVKARNGRRVFGG